MKNQTLLFLGLILAAPAARADGPHFSANKYDPDSTSNPYGRYGSPYSPDSVNNPYGSGFRLEPRPPARYTEPPIFTITPPAPDATAHDFSALSTLGAPGSGLKFKTETLPEPSQVSPEAREEAEIEQSIPEPQENIFDALEAIRKEAAK